MVLANHVLYIFEIVRNLFLPFFISLIGLYLFKANPNLLHQAFVQAKLNIRLEKGFFGKFVLLLGKKHASSTNRSPFLSPNNVSLTHR